MDGQAAKPFIHDQSPFPALADRGAPEAEGTQQWGIHDGLVQRDLGGVEHLPRAPTHPFISELIVI